MSDTQIMMKVPEEVITAQVKAAVASVLNKDPERLVRAVVDAAMAQKKDHYDKRSLWEEELNTMIRAVAREEFVAFLAEQRPGIAKLVREKLGGSKSKILDDLVGRVVDGVKNVNVAVHWPGKDY